MKVIVDTEGLVPVGLGEWEEMDHFVGSICVNHNGQVPASKIVLAIEDIANLQLRDIQLISDQVLRELWRHLVIDKLRLVSPLAVILSA